MLSSATLCVAGCAEALRGGVLLHHAVSLQHAHKRNHPHFFKITHSELLPLISKKQESKVLSGNRIYRESLISLGLCVIYLFIYKFKEKK